MLYTSMRVIHQTDRFIVSKYAGGLVYIIEKLSPNGFVVGVLALQGLEAPRFEGRWKAKIEQSVNTRPLAKPFAVDDMIELSYFAPKHRQLFAA